MKRKLNALELRRQREQGSKQLHEESGGNEQQKESPSKKRSPSKAGAGGGGSPKRARIGRGYGSTPRKEDPREHQNLNREEIALMFMEVSEKIDRCFDFDLQKWLGRYEGLRAKEHTNFPEAAMLVMSAAQIYGRKVDYLEEIILHMDQDQKGRGAVEESQEEGSQKEDKPTGGRKRAARFQPQSLSDCFGDLEFSAVDGKKAPIGSLVTSVERVAVDQRNKFQQMQELCNELRTMPTKQRRQEILNRLRDDANIPPIMSSHTAARKNQILDLESGETIGTRYDFQIYLNFIDVKTGSLMPEHDLRKFFQRCDVIDYLFEQECAGKGKNDGSDDIPSIFPLKPREFKIYMPPDYLRNKYGIEVDDTADFDNELHKAKSSNYRKDPILEMMQSKFADRGKHAELWEAPAAVQTNPEEDPSTAIESSANPDTSSNSESDSTPFEDSGTFDDSQITDPANDSSTSTEDPPTQSSIIISIISEHDRDEFPKSKESSPEPELMALEAQSGSDSDKQQPNHPGGDGQCPSRLSLEDEGIGIDRESLGKQTPSDLGARSPSLDKLSDDGAAVAVTATATAPEMFNSGLVVLSGTRTISLKPALLERNLFKIPECHLRKHLLFSLPPEYKRMKMDLVRKASDRSKDMFTLIVYSLSPPKNSQMVRRASTEEMEDFLGFDEYADILQGPLGKCLYSLAPPSDGQRSNVSRASSAGSDFFGFDNEEPMTRGIVCNENDDIARVADFDDDDGGDREEAPTSCDPVQNEPRVAEVAPSEKEQPAPEAEKPQSDSQHSTPTRTMSRDSGISDDQNEQLRQSRSKEGTPEPQQEGTSGEASLPQTEENETLSSAKYIQSVAEAKELIEKVNSWHRKLKPILIQSEKRNHFDIHAYGTEIIDSFGSEQSEEETSMINFAQVMENKPEDFTARYFLSMLMLANTNNVQIATRNHDPQRLTRKEDIELRLLSRKRHHQEMESMGERIPCDNTPSGRLAAGGVKSKSPRGMKRKRLIDDGDEDEGMEDDEGELSGIRRLHDDDDPDHGFLERIRRIYPDINSEETKRKRIAFRRGMRQCAYGLQDEERSSVPPPQPPEPMEPAPEEDDPDEIMSIDLETNEAIMMAPPAVPVFDPDPCCSKSLVSAAESGYGSMIEASDC